jgi:hypothetical protein
MTLQGYASYGILVSDDVLVSKPIAGAGFVGVANIMVVLHMLASFQVCHRRSAARLMQCSSAADCHCTVHVFETAWPRMDNNDVMAQLKCAYTGFPCPPMAALDKSLGV